MQRAGKPKSWKTWQVRTDAFKFRQAGLTGESQYHPVKTGNPKQVETQGREGVVLGADEPVVVINPKPMKAGNRLEEKT
ncbi:hypothetical protein H0A61_00439 [Koleobacter methoxysyntrophicus]|uniref:Uncharacterized protein n=1 Tax=Koleobacter methoxysyntrophicus TaxID=2751313 RepID=A0A8A0RKR4_9FIRM|nr:hypothetical protein H0A61_00439 [Koleobacter methoxysyntrophicus]